MHQTAEPAEIVIRPETEADGEDIAGVVTAAFGQSEEADLVKRLRTAGALTLSLVAEAEGRIAGHVAFSPVTVNGKAGGMLGLAPLAVRPDYQRWGIGGALCREGIARCRDSGAAGLVLVGDTAYYRRFGFESGPPLGWHWDAQPDLAAFQVLLFQRGEFGTGPHRVRYRDEFSVL